MTFSNLFFLNRPRHGPTTDDRSDEFSDGWLPSNHSTYVVCECKHAISNNPKEKNHTLKDRKSEGVTARLRNGKWGARETCFEQWSLTRLQCSLCHHLVEATHRHSPPSPAYLLSNTHSKDVRFSWVTLYIQNRDNKFDYLVQNVYVLVLGFYRWVSRYSDWLRAGRSGIESRWRRHFPPVLTGPVAHPASCKMGTGRFPGLKCGPGRPADHSLLF